MTHGALNAAPLGSTAFNGPGPSTSAPPTPLNPIVGLIAWKGLVSLYDMKGRYMQLTATAKLTMAMLASATAGTPPPNPLSAAHVGLFIGTAPVVGGQVSTPINEPTYPGYSRVALLPANWQAPAQDGDGSVSTLNSTPTTFRMTDDTTPTTIMGVFLADAVGPGGNVLAVGQFDQPMNLLNALMAISIVVVVGLPANLNLGAPPIIA